MKSRQALPNRQSLRLRHYDYTSRGPYFVTMVTQNRVRAFGHVNGGVMKLSQVGEIVHAALAEMEYWYDAVHVDEFQVMPDHVHAIIWLSRRSSAPPPSDATTPDPSVATPKPSDATTPDPSVATPTPPSATTPAGAGPRARPPRLGCADQRQVSATTPPSAAPRAPGPGSAPVSNHDQVVVNGNPTRDVPNRRRNGDSGNTSRGRPREAAPTAVVASEGVGNATIEPALVPSESVSAFKPLTLGDVVQRFKSLTTTRYRHGVVRLGWRVFSGRLWQRNYYERAIRDERALINIRRYIRNNPRNIGAPRRRRK